MGDYIKRNEIKIAMESVTGDTTCPLHLAAEIDQILELAPAADVRPERHGRWIYHHDIHGISYSCSNCTCGLSDTGTEHYCHYCGAKMDGKDV